MQETPILHKSVKWDFTLCMQFYMHWLCTLVVLNCCCEASGTCVDPVTREAWESMMHMQVILSLCMLSSVSCFKSESDYPDPNVERSMSLRHPVKGKLIVIIYRVLSSLCIHVLECVCWDVLICCFCRITKTAVWQEECLIIDIKYRHGPLRIHIIMAPHE